MNDGPIKIAVLLDSYSVQRWEKNAIQKLLSNNQLDVSTGWLIVNDESSQTSPRSRLDSLVSDSFLYILLRIYHILYKYLNNKPTYRETIPISEVDEFENAEIIPCEPVSSDGVGNELPTKAINVLSRSDIGIRFGFGILKGKALTVPQYGVLSYHHGDLTKYRGRPAGFYEFLHDESTAGVTVQKLNEQLDGGSIAAITQVDISDADSWGEVKSRLFEHGTDLLSESVYRCVCEPTEVKTADSVGKLYTTPSNKQMVLYLIKRLKILLT